MTTQTLSARAALLHRSGRLADAERLYQEALAADSRDFTARHLLGVLRAQQGRGAEALAEISQALDIRPGDAEALLNRANILKTLDRPHEALAGYDAALAQRPGWPQALNNRGTVLQALGRFDAALADYDAALARQGDYAEALSNRGSVLQDLRRPAQALESLDAAIRLQPQSDTAFNNRGSALLELKRFGDALADFDRALALRPANAGAANNRGNALQGLKRYDEAVASYDRALAIHPGDAQCLTNRGGALAQLKRHAEALASFDAALACDPAQKHAFGGAAMAALNLCDWARADEMAAQMARRVLADEVIAPWTLLGYGGDENLHLRAARNAIRERFPALPAPLWRGEDYRHDKIRLAYVSSDFGQHPVAQQIVQMIEGHDRARFTVLGLATGTGDRSALRRRMAAAFDTFHDVSAQDSRASAELLRRAEVDIVIDLNGHTSGDNFDILSHRAAPVQASWLGYPGSTGADFIDYLIADRIVAPDASAFSEKIAHLPGSFFAADTARSIGPAPARAAEGLPETGFVFCSFNNNWKITAPVFAVWMRLLAAMPGSVLWLKQSTPAAAENLRRAARDHGVDPARLVFAGNAPGDVHLGRHALADLFLDTLPYNAHATACDALLAGLPVLTQRGTAFAGRVAASLLHAAGLPGLVTESLADYEALARALARDPAALARHRAKLAARNAPLFDTPRFTREIEALYVAMLSAVRP